MQVNACVHLAMDALGKQSGYEGKQAEPYNFICFKKVCN